MKLGGNVYVHNLFRDYGRAVRFTKGEVIIHPTHPKQEFYYIQAGFVKSYDITSLGFCNLFFIYQAGELFPMQQILNTKPPSLFYEAMTSVSLQIIQKDAFTQHLVKDAQLLEATSQQLLSLLDRYTNRIGNLLYRTARERLLFRLLELVHRFGIKRGNGVIIAAPITHQDIADSINITRETTSREIQRLIREGVLRQDNHLLIVRDLGRLNREVS